MAIATKGQDKEAECPICRHHCRMQRLVPCGHRICGACVTKLEQFAAVDVEKRCPFCRQHFTVLKSPKSLVQILSEKLVWRLPKPDGLRRLPIELRAELFSHLKNGRLLYGDILAALLEGLCLDKLKLSDATNLTAPDLHRVASLLGTPPRIVVLSNVPMLNDEGLRSLLERSAPILEHLNTDSASEDFLGTCLQEYAGKLPRLSQLETPNCRNLEPAAFSAIITGIAPTLRVLDASGCRKVGNDAILSLVNCTHLQRLDLHGLWKLETPPLLHVLEACTRLQALNVTHCRKLVGPELLRGIAAFCTELRDLTAGAVPEVDDEAAIPMALSTAGASLENWCLAGSDISNRTLRAIADNCPILCRVDISDCHEIMENGVLDLIMGLKQLRICQTKYCRNISTQFQLFAAQMLSSRALGVGDVTMPAKTRGSRVAAPPSPQASCRDCASDDCSSTAAPSTPSSGSSGPSSLPASSGSPSSSSNSCSAGSLTCTPFGNMSKPCNETELSSPSMGSSGSSSLPTSPSSSSSSYPTSRGVASVTCTQFMSMASPSNQTEVLPRLDEDLEHPTASPALSEHGFSSELRPEASPSRPASRASAAAEVAASLEQAADAIRQSMSCQQELAAAQPPLVDVSSAEVQDAGGSPSSSRTSAPSSALQSPKHGVQHSLRSNVRESSSITRLATQHKRTATSVTTQSQGRANAATNEARLAPANASRLSTRGPAPRQFSSTSVSSRSSASSLLNAGAAVGGLDMTPSPKAAAKGRSASTTRR